MMSDELYKPPSSEEIAASEARRARFEREWADYVAAVTAVWQREGQRLPVRLRRRYYSRCATAIQGTSLTVQQLARSYAEAELRADTRAQLRVRLHLLRLHLNLQKIPWTVSGWLCPWISASASHREHRRLDMGRGPPSTYVAHPFSLPNRLSTT